MRRRGKQCVRFLSLLAAAERATDGAPVALTLVPKRDGTPNYLERFVPMPEC